MAFAYPVVSADSHSTEPPNTYVDHMTGAWRNRAPKMVFSHADDTNRRRLLRANDFPRSDSTWPWSQDMLAEAVSAS